MCGLDSTDIQGGFTLTTACFAQGVPSCCLVTCVPRSMPMGVRTNGARR